MFVPLFSSLIVFHLYHDSLASIYNILVSKRSVAYTLGTHPLFIKSLNFVKVAQAVSVIQTSTFQFVITPLLSNSYVTLSIVRVSPSNGFQLYFILQIA